MRDGFVAVAAGTPQVRVADCVYNGAQTIQLVRQAAEAGVKLLVLPELGLTGATCGDLFYQPTLLYAAETALETVLAETEELETVFVVGLPVRAAGLLYNCAAVCQKGEILGIVPKTHLTAEECRWFAAAPMENAGLQLCGQAVLFGTDLLFCCAELPEFVLGVEIGQDLWAPVAPSSALAAAGAAVIACPSADCEAVGRAAYRQQLVTGQSARTVSAYVYANAGDGESTSDVVYGGHDLIAEN